MMEKADRDGSRGREALPCLEQMAKSSQLSPAKPLCPQGLGGTSRGFNLAASSFHSSGAPLAKGPEITPSAAWSFQWLHQFRHYQARRGLTQAHLPALDTQHVFWLCYPISHWAACPKGLLKCLLPFCASAKKQPSLGWPQLVVQHEGEALGGLHLRQIPGRASSRTAETSSPLFCVTTASAEPFAQ